MKNNLNKVILIGIFFSIFSISAFAEKVCTPKGNWGDSYAVKGECYCATTFDHGIGKVKVMTPDGLKTIKEICEKLGKGPGKKGNPVYNDIQCGNGPPNDAGDEDPDCCPGRVDMGKKGCKIIGPKWNLERIYGTENPGPTAGPNTEKCGDVNDDNNVDIIDALLLAQKYVGKYIEKYNVKTADVNGDGADDIVDALLIAKFYVGQIENLNC